MPAPRIRQVLSGPAPRLVALAAQASIGREVALGEDDAGRVARGAELSESGGERIADRGGITVGVAKDVLDVTQAAGQRARAVRRLRRPERGVVRVFGQEIIPRQDPREPGHVRDDGAALVSVRRGQGAAQQSVDTDGSLRADLIDAPGEGLGFGQSGPGRAVQRRRRQTRRALRAGVL